MISRTFSRITMERLIRLGLRGLPDTPEDYRAYIDGCRHNELPRLPRLPRLSVVPPLLTMEGLPTFVFGAKSDPAQPTVLYLHGGSYLDNPIFFHYESAAELAAHSGWRVLLPLYGKIPQKNWQDAFPPLHRLLDSLIAELSADRVALWGDSAGGGLAAGLLMERVRDKRSLPGRLILFSPWLDATMSNPDAEALAPLDPMLAAWRLRICGEYWAGGDDPRRFQISPLFGNPAGFPPTLLFTGTREIFCPDICRFDEMLEAAGVRHKLHVAEDQFHDYALYPTAEGAAARGEAVKELKDSETMYTNDKHPETVYLAAGCFWGAQKYFDQFDGVLETTVGYANGPTPFPSYKDVCADSGHAETVQIVFDPARLPLKQLLREYFEIIDPLAVNRQGEDSGIQYRTGIYWSDPAQLPVIREICREKEALLGAPLAVELKPLENFYAAEEYHQKYLDKNPNGYCHIPAAKFSKGADPD